MILKYHSFVYLSPLPPRVIMEVYSPNMSEASVCHLKQLPCHSAPFLRLQGCGHHTNNLPSVACKSRTNGSQSTGASSSSTVRHRGSGVGAGGCSNPECAASRLVEEAVAARGSSKGKVVVTGGAGYFGFSLGKELAGEGMSVILMDLNRPPNEIPDGAVFYQVLIPPYIFRILHLLSLYVCPTRPWS